MPTMRPAPREPRAARAAGAPQTGRHFDTCTSTECTVRTEKCNSNKSTRDETRRKFYDYESSVQRVSTLYTHIHHRAGSGTPLTGTRGYRSTWYDTNCSPGPGHAHAGSRAGHRQQRVRLSARHNTQGTYSSLCGDRWGEDAAASGGGGVTFSRALALT